MILNIRLGNGFFLKVGHNIGVLLIALGLFACGGKTQPPPISYLVKTEAIIMSGPSGNTFTYYYYDSLGRIKTQVLVWPSIFAHDGQDSAVMAYVYFKDSIIKTRTTRRQILYTDTFNLVTDTDIYYLNSEGYVAGKKGVRFHYDDKWFLVRIDFPPNIGAYDFSILNGDIISKREYSNTTNIVRKTDEAKRLIGTINFTYDTIVMDTRDFGKKFLGSRSTHLIKTSTEIPGTARETTTTYYSYIFDMFGRVETMSLTRPGYWKKISYTYY